MNKREACDALERAALDVEYMDGAVDPGAPPSPTAALLRTLKKRIERGEEAGPLILPRVVEIKRRILIIDWSEGEGG